MASSNIVSEHSELVLTEPSISPEMEAESQNDPPPSSPLPGPGNGTENQNQIQQSPLISTFPAEIILCIGDHLQGAGRLLLSQTCRPLRAIFRNNGTIADVSQHSDKYTYRALLHVLARNRVDVWVCNTCSTMHRIDYKHTAHVSPWDESRLSSYGHFHFENRLEEDPWLDPTRNFFIFAKAQQPLVQLALRMTRLRAQCTPEQDAYLQILMQPFYTQHCNTQGKKYGVWCRPKVVDVGGTLFYMVRTSIYLQKTEDADNGKMNLLPIPLCDHQLLQRIRGDRRKKTPFVAHILPPPRPPFPVSFFNPAWLLPLLCGSPGIATATRGGGCAHCLTDYTIENEDKHSTMVTAWQCYGTETTATNIVPCAEEDPAYIKPHDGRSESILPWGAKRRELRPQAPSGWVRDCYRRSPTLPDPDRPQLPPRPSSGK